MGILSAIRLAIPWDRLHDKRTVKRENRNRISVGIDNDSGALLTFAICKTDALYTAEHNSGDQNTQMANRLAFDAAPDEVKTIYGAGAQNVYENGAYLYLA